MPTSTDALGGLVEQAATRARDIRHDLHRHPELGHEEHRTAGVVCEELRGLGIEFVAGLAEGTGVLGWLPATGDAGKAIALRADMDALPIEEETGCAYASLTSGLMHACGHDGHTAMLLGAARVLAGMDERPNDVMFVFQPAEEGGGGGRMMCEDGALNGTRIGRPIDMIYGLHGWPDLRVGDVATRTGALLAATNEFDLVVRGRGGHAAHPEVTRDPIVASAHLVTALQTIASRRVEAADALVVTVGSIQGGHANNVIPETVKMKGTLRTLTKETRQLGIASIEQVCAGVAASMGVKIDIDWWGGYPSTHNHPEPTARFRRIAMERLGSGRVHERPSPTMGGEDFAYYGEHVPASFFFLGLKPEGRETYPSLHHPTFDFNDDALATGIELMAAMALGDA